MRPVAITVVSFVYILGLGLWFVDATLFEADEALTARDLQGRPLDTAALARAGGGGDAGAGSTDAWTIVELASGAYAFNVLDMIGVNPNLMTVIKAIFPVVAAVTIIHYVKRR